MESSSSQPANHSPLWANNGRSQSAAPADPLAFFDLIMSSAKAMSDKGNTNPLISNISPSNSDASGAENRTETSGDDSWQEDSPGQASAYVPSENSQGSRPSEASHDDAPEEDVAAVAELSQEASTDGEQTEQPDEAAEATAAAAGTAEQLLAAPDTLDAVGEEASDVVVEDAVANPQKPASKADAEVIQPIDTDAPLDTSAVNTEGESESEDAKASLELNVQEEPVAESQDVEPGEEKDLPLEEVALDQASEVTQEHSEEVEQAREKTTEEVELEAESEETASSEEIETTNESTSDREGRSRDRQSSKVEAKPQTQTSTENVRSNSTTTTQASTAAAEVAAAASSAAAAPANAGTNGAPTSGSNNVPGMNNLASLLQRGLQRGTLQKSTESKSTPQLDPKQQVRLINRVARAVESTPPGQSIKIRLNPSELGQLKVEITIEKGNMIAKIEAENPGTRQVLMQHLPQLRERLAESNINIQQFDVDLMGQESPQDGGATNLADQQQQSGDNAARRSPQVAGPASVEEEAESPSEPKVNLEAERDSRNLNVTI